MSLSKREREEMLAHCGEIHPDDGVDPREFFRKSGSPKKTNYKVYQLCRQVAETLDQILSGELVVSGKPCDDLLDSLRVMDVVPAPDSSRLLVTLACDGRNEVRTIEKRLSVMNGWLRSEVAAAITRRKVPTLAFRIIDAGLMTREEELP